MSYNIGSQLKYFRKEKKLTLKQIAAKTNLSVSLLSNIERGLRSPTIVNLQKICTAIGITINELLIFSDVSHVLHKNERKTVFSEDTKASDVLYQSISVGHSSLKGMCMTVSGSNQKHESYGHTVDEMGVIISGSMTMTIDTVEYTVEEGDSIYIPAGTYHDFCKISEEPCISYWFISSESEEDFNHTI